MKILIFHSWINGKAHSERAFHPKLDSFLILFVYQTFFFFLLSIGNSTLCHHLSCFSKFSSSILHKIVNIRTLTKKSFLRINQNWKSSLLTASSSNFASTMSEFVFDVSAKFSCHHFFFLCHSFDVGTIWFQSTRKKLSNKKTNNMEKKLQ